MQICLHELDRIINNFKDMPGNLIPVLHAVQSKIGYLPIDAQNYIARTLKVPLSKVYGVVTFYSLFSTEPKGKHTIGICLGTACYVKGAEKIVDKIKEELNIKIGETTKDKKFTMTITRCLGTCSMAPVIMIDDKIYGNVTTNMVPEILNSYGRRR